MEENKRLKELKLSLYINYIDKAGDKIAYNYSIKILSALMTALGQDYYKEFFKFLQLTIGKYLLKATDKDIIATCKKYFSNKKAAKLLGMSHSWYNKKYADLLNRNFDTKEYLDSLQPIFNSKEGITMVNFLTSFIENFKYELGKKEHPLANKERTLELEFLLIYNKLMDIFHNAGLCDIFIFYLCNMCDIDYTTIAQLKNNIHVINRSYPYNRYGRRYLMQEIVTLYTDKGLKKGTIGSKVLNKSSSFLYNGTNKKFDVIKKDDMDWQYLPAINWRNLNKEAVKKFIRIFHTFIRYDI